MTSFGRRAVLAAGVALVLAVSGCGSGDSGGSGGGEGGARTPSPIPTTTASGTVRLGEPRELVTGLEVPWAIAFLPGGDALVTQRDNAELVRVSPQGQVTPVGEVPGVVPGGEGGLMGVAVSPDYQRNQTIYLYFTAADDNRVVRARYDGRRLTGVRPIVTGIPKAGNHNGGRIAFGPDRYLYVATGEAGQVQLSQERESLGGKILRVTTEGRPAPGNPYGTQIWSWGHRNVQGMAWDGERRMFATEFGQNTYDEINRIEPGKNYGWPEVEGVGDEERFTNPLLTWSTAEASPSGLAFAGGSLWA
ncbi:PQQ-dependent sugar dehydrogenase, partial [Actinomadura adrarensis]